MAPWLTTVYAAVTLAPVDTETVPPWLDTPVVENVENAPVPGVPLPIEPGLANVAPDKLEAFKFATFVVDVTAKGAVPVATVDVNVGALTFAPLLFTVISPCAVTVESNDAGPVTSRVPTVAPPVTTKDEVPLV